MDLYFTKSIYQLGNFHKTFSRLILEASNTNLFNDKITTCEYREKQIP